MSAKSEGEIDLDVWDKLKESKWPKEFVKYQHTFAPGRLYKIEDDYGREQQFRPDFVLYYRPDIKNAQERPIAIIENKKAANRALAVGMNQTIDYGELIGTKFAYVSNGEKFVEYSYITGKISKPFSDFPSPEELWDKSQEKQQFKEEDFSLIFQPYNREIRNSDLTVREPRYYQVAAIEAAIDAIVNKQKRVLITMATGTGKTFVAMQIVWKLWKPKKRKPRILYLVDRTFLQEQAEDLFQKPFKSAITRIKEKGGGIIKSKDIYFSLYQGIHDKKEAEGIYKKYNPDFFDYIIIDEAHRGSAKDDGSWRAILDYFQSAVHIGMTATPQTKENANTYRYFKKPVYVYSLKQGIDDGFLSPYSVIRIISNVDEKGWEPRQGQKDVYGEEIPDKKYQTKDFDRKITLEPRVQFVAKKLIEYLKKTNVYDKTLVFCQDQQHALDLATEINNLKPVNHPRYCVRIVSEERANVKKQLKDQFSDPESKFPVIVTTSKLLSTGIDIPTLKNIVIDKTIKDKVEFKQTVGRGTRVNITEKPFSTKYWFTIIDHRGASELFKDPSFDGQPDDIQIEDWSNPQKPKIKKKIIRRPRTIDVTRPIKFKKRPVVDGFEVDESSKSFYKLDADGNRLTMYKYEDYSKEKIRELYPDKMKLYKLLIDSGKRRKLREDLAKVGIDLKELQKITKNTDKDAFEVVVNIAHGDSIISRREKTEQIKKNSKIFKSLSETAKKTLELFLDLYAEEGFSELEKPREILLLPQIKKIGSPLEIVKEFGSYKKYEKAVICLTNEIYKR